MNNVILIVFVLVVGPVVAIANDVTSTAYTGDITALCTTSLCSCLSPVGSSRASLLPGVLHQPRSPEPDVGHTEESAVSEPDLRQVRPAQRSVVAPAQPLVHTRSSYARNRHDDSLSLATPLANAPNPGEKR